MSLIGSHARRRARWQIDNAVHAALRMLSNNRRARTALELLLPAVNARTTLLRPAGGPRGWRDAELFLHGLTSLAQNQYYWKNPLWEWSLPDNVTGARPQFNHLVKHLFNCPHMPFFMHSVWLLQRAERPQIPQGWYRQLAAGRSIRGCSTPLKLSRKAGAYFALAADHLSARQALRWAQARGAGASERLAKVIAKSRFGSHFDHEEYCRALTRVLVRFEAKVIAAGDLYKYVGPLIEHLHTRRDDFPPVMLAALETADLEYLLLSKGKLPERMRLRWKASGIGGFHLHETSGNGWAERTWRIRELLTAGELFDEGRAQGNCVRLYVGSCCRGASSIWSMTCEGSSTKRRVMTIEVDPHRRRIVEALAQYNAGLGAGPRNILMQWARDAELTVAGWV